jgi:hypothetical protein
MKLEVRSKTGNMFGKYLGSFAEALFSVLNENEKSFTLTVKKFKSDRDPSIPVETPVFVSNEYQKLTITNEFELWLEPGDYIKIIR